MSKNKIIWSPNGTDLPTIEPHTKAKHQILEDYVSDWIFTLCGNNMGKKKTVTLIDGFCGGGMYRDKNHQFWYGSPIRLIKAVEKGLERVKKDKSKPDYELNVKYIFIDNQQPHIDCLKKQMQLSGLDKYVNNPNICSFICKDFEGIVSKIITELEKRKGSSLFILDPFGYTDVSMQTIRKIISLRKTEIIYTYMIDFIRRFIKERKGSLENAFNNILEADGYYELANLEKNIYSQQEYLRNETLRLFRDKGQAPYVYSFALLQTQRLVTYYLIHLANSPTAQKVIKNSLWIHNTMNLSYQFNYDVYGMGFRSPDFYDFNQRLFDINDGNERTAIENLNNDVINYLHGVEQTEFETLHNLTMQFNPATAKHYELFIDEQRDAGEIEVLRNGKKTKARNLKSTDIITRPKYKQLQIIDINKYRSSIIKNIK